MKLRNLLVLGALLISGSVWAERQKPVLTDYPVETIEIDGKSEYYMYNAGAKKFWVGANAWGTQASVGPTGWKVRFSQYVAAEGEAWDGKTVLFEDFAKNSSWLKAWFVAGDHIMYTDYNNQADYLWCIQKVGSAYRLSASELNPDATVAGNAALFVGIDATKGDSIVYSNLDVAETSYIDWTFFSAAAYDAALSLYDDALLLGERIAEAEAKGIDVAAQKQVYNNDKATAEEIAAAVTAVNKAISLYEENSVDPYNPVDKTSSIANPSYDANTNDGWSGTTPGFQSYTDAEHYNKTFNSWQMLENIPNGLYKMSVQGFYRPATSGANGAVFYAANGTDSLTAIVPDLASEAANIASLPNNMQSAEEAFVAGLYVTELVFVVTNNQVRIGITLPELTGGSDWVIWDNWKLTYYGNKETSYDAIVKEIVAKNLTKYDDQLENMTDGVFDVYSAAISNLTATDLAGVATAQEAIAAAAAVVDANVAAWTEFKRLYEEADGLTADPDIDQDSEYAQAVAIYVMIDGGDIYANMELATEPLLAEIDKIAKLIDDAKKKSLKLDAVVTQKFLTNYDFENVSDAKNDGKGWEGKWLAFGGPAHNKCMEGWNCEIDLRQTVTGAPQGVYEVSLQGFYRLLRGQAAYDLYEAGGQTCPVSIYVNNNSTGFKCVFDEPVEVGSLYTEQIWTKSDSTAQYPDGMVSAGEAFAVGMYQATAHGVVAQDGQELVLGVKGDLSGGDNWAIWDDFKMVYRGKQIKYVLPHLQEAIIAATENLKKNMDKTTKESVEKAKTAAEGLLNSTDEDKVFQALVDLYATNDAVAASVALYAQLEDAASGLYEKIAVSVAADAVKAEAGTLAETTLAGVAEGVFTAAEVEQLLKDIKLMVIKLSLPDYGDASPENPADFTPVLQNPDFGDAIGVNSVAGWDGTSGYNFGNDDTQKGALALEFYEKTFDMSQTVIGGLPNGAYRVEVNAFGRLGSTDADFSAPRDTMPATRAIIYAMSSTDSTTLREVPVKLLSETACAENLSSGSTSITDEAGNTLYFPNDMVSAGVWFGAGYNKHELYVEVKDNTIKLGIKKAESAGSHWVIMDNWKLYYLGPDGTVGIEDVVAGGEVVSVAVYNANGVQLNGVQKGINIIRTVYSNGAVTVKKVIK